MKLFKQVVGIDVSSETLAISIGTIDQSQAIKITHRSTHKNTTAGFKQLLTTVEKQRTAVLVQHGLEADELPLWFVMEASGVYYECLAVWLTEHQQHVCVALANSVKAHSRSDNRKSKTDRIDADVVAHYGLEKSLKPWQPLAPTMAELKSLVREHNMVNEEMTATKNRLHALEKSAATPKHTVKRLRQRRDLLKRQRKQIEHEIKELISNDPELKHDAECLDSAPGIGILTAATVLAETNRFQLVERGEQLVSYVGIDPTMHQSGKHNGTVRISRKGNSVLRHALYMPALTAIRCIPSMNALYQRIVAKTGIKMKGIVAVMRKLTMLMYTLWQKQERFDPNYGPAAKAAA